MASSWQGPCRRRGRRGATAAMTLFCMTAALGATGLATDFGLAVVRNQQLQSVVGGAAMAGGMQFGQGTQRAEDSAQAFARAHGYALRTEAGTVSQETVAANNVFCKGTPTRLDIDAWENVPTFFLRVFGTSSIRVAARAAVERTGSTNVPVNRVAGTIECTDPADSGEKEYFGAITPLALNAALFPSHVEFENMSPLLTFNLGPTGDDEPVAWLVNLGDSLADGVRRGSSRPVSVGDTLSVSDESLVNAAAWLQTRTGVDPVPTERPGDTQSWRRLSSDRRVLVVPVVKATSDAQVQVVGFAAVQVTWIKPSSGQIQVKLVNTVMRQAEIDAQVKSDHGSLAEHYGLFGFHLCEWKGAA